MFMLVACLSNNLFRSGSLEYTDNSYSNSACLNENVRNLWDIPCINTGISGALFIDIFMP